MLRAKGIRVTVLSTGLLLKRNARQIATNVDDLIVSLDGPPAVHDQIRRVAGAFDKLADGVQAVRTHNPALPIAARCTVQKHNHAHLVRTAAAAEDLGLTSISFLAADLTSEAFNRPDGWDRDRQSGVALALDEIQRLEAEFSSLQERWGATGFVLEGSDKLARIVRHFKAHLGLTKSEAPKCNAPWVSVVVEANGSVRPCFFHSPIGSLQTHTLLQVVNGFEAQAFRRSLDIPSNPTCKRCVCSLNLPVNYAESGPSTTPNT
jgi:MoaA/NifB/PqqE/SkfB family radical SAM enzyme